MINSTVLITGASSGIGQDFAKIFAKNGYNLFLTARNTNKLIQLQTELQNEFKISVDYCNADLAKPYAAKIIFDYAIEKNIKVDILINNAGFAVYGNFEKTDLNIELEMIQVNISALTELTKYFSKDMVLRKSGKILNVASLAAYEPGPLMAAYYASKAYVLSFSEALHNEFKDYGITVTALCPGPTRTGFSSRANMDNSPLFKGNKVKSSYDVALAGYKGLFNNKDVVIPGLGNKLMAFATRFAPRQMAATMAKNMQSI